MAADETAEQPSRRIIEQRVRNQLIEYFKWASSFEEQRAYQAAVPAGVSVVNEVIEQWYDWAPKPVVAEGFGPVYSSDEIEAMMAYDSVMVRAIDSTPNLRKGMEHFQALPIWEELRQAAAAALTVFVRRGRLPDDHEV